MSRDDPQFKLRMPIELREKAEQAAKASGRSLNGELVARLETTFLSSGNSENLLNARRARELALMARSGIPGEIRKRIVESIGKAVHLGHSEASADLEDLRLSPGIPDEELDDLVKEITEELEKAGYSVKWDDITYLTVSF